MRAALIGSSLLVALSSAPVAYAQTAAYLGGGLSAGLTGGSGPGEGSSTGGMVTGRYALPVPVRLSLRGDVLFGRKTAFVPTLSIDLPFEGNLLSLGAGASIATAGDDASPLGSRSAFVLRTGFDRFIEDSSLVLVSSFLVGFGAYSDSGTAVAFNVGLAVGF